MHKVYPAEEMWRFITIGPGPNPTPNNTLYAYWELKPILQTWLNDNCTESWKVESAVDFTWDVHDNWMNTVIDNMCRTPSTGYIDITHYNYWPYDVCKPHIVFESVADAMLFKLTF